MKTKYSSVHTLAHCHWPAGLHPVGLGILVVIYSSELLFAGKPLPSAGRSSAPHEEMLQLDPGPIGVTSTTRPALWSFDPPQGQIQLASEAAGEATTRALELPRIDPRTDLITSVAGLIAAPIVATISGVHASHQRLPSAKLTEVQAGLVTALTTMAQQHHLRDALIAASQSPHSRRFIPLESSPENQFVNTILEMSVTELRLVRLGASDASFALRLKARARLLRGTDQAVLSDTTITYQTEPDLFLDWALNQGTPFQNCTRTGYRQVADQIIADINRRSGAATILVGPGQKHTAPPLPRLCRATIKFQANPLPPVATLRLASQPQIESGTLYVIPAPAPDFFAVQKPLTRDEALAAAVADINQAGTEAIQHPNLCVTLTGLAVLTPIGLYHQTLGLAFHGVSEKSIRAADAPLARAIASAQPSQALATQLAQQLGTRDFGTVVLLTKPARDPNQLARAPTPLARPILTRWPATAADNFRTGDQLLKVEVLHTALHGPPGANSKLALGIAARITVVNVVDGRELYTCTAQYQSHSYSYSRWAAHEARLLRTELTRSYEQLSTTALHQMLTRRWLTPPPKPPATLAGNLN